MDIEQPTREEWKRLFDAAIAVKALAPWQWKQVLQALAAEIGSSVKLVRRLPALSEVQEEFLAFMAQ